MAESNNDDTEKRSDKWVKLKDLLQDINPEEQPKLPEWEAINLDNIQVDHVEPGFDGNGNWEVGAIATVIDIVGGTAAVLFSGHLHVTVDLTVSYLSTAKIHEEVEIEAKVVADKQKKMTAVKVGVKRRQDGQLIALGKLWMASTNIHVPLSKL